MGSAERARGALLRTAKGINRRSHLATMRSGARTAYFAILPTRCRSSGQRHRRMSANCDRRVGQAGVSISLVFTPKDARGQGFATSLVSSVCDFCLKTHARVALFADNGDPSKSLVRFYESLGFDHRGQYTQLLFEEAERGDPPAGTGADSA
mmetsp:Transcript_17580/g.44895  ORF Transcript_17580/g.44895 Transcript_17580/m.44895 type:complete len:152 (-) Transcript_17580:103-558(-)